MKYHFLIFILLSFGLTTYSQRPASSYGGGRGAASSIKGKVTGKLIDNNSKEGLGFASVALVDTVKRRTINGTITDEDGRFKLSNVPIGEYELRISFVGYESKSISVILSNKKPDVNLAEISMVANLKELDEVVIEGERELVENKIDKIVYNAERDVANAGGDASDVLRRAPLLSVDLEGNVSLRGSQNVQILVNGKPSSMFAGSPGDALRAIPADQIKSVEVITSPSAKYDGEGTAGIINIITKKSNVEGFTGNINLSAGNLSNRGVVGITAGKGRFGFNANGSAFYSVPRDGSTTFLRRDDLGTETRLLTEDGDNVSDRLGFFATAGAFYDFNAFHSISSSFRLRGFTSDRENDIVGEFSDPINMVDQNYRRVTDTENLFSGYEWSLDYTFKVPEQKGREVAISYKIDGNVQDQDFRIGQEDLVGEDPDLLRNERSLNDGNNTEITYQADYTHPVNDNFKVETGAKMILRNVTSDFRNEEFNIIDEERTDFLDYDQNVYAAYASTNIKIGKNYGLIAGARYEFTEIAGQFRDDDNNPFKNDYENILPSIIFNRKFGRTTSAKVSYSRRIQRPSLRVINPFEDRLNNRDVRAGNPALEPELTDQYEFSYNTYVKKVSINIALFYRRTTDIIESVLLVDDDGVGRTTFQNVGTANSIGTNIFTSATLFKIWTLRGGINLFTYDGTGTIDGQRVSNQALLWNGNLNSNIKLKKDWVIDMFGFYRAPRQTLQGVNPSFSIFSMGIRKQIWEKRGSIGIRIVEPFFPNKSFGSELSGDTFFQESEVLIPFRSFGINFSYKFGKLDFKQRQRRSKIRNDDVERGGSDSQGQF
ncbi:MAG: TonB-dependent receptor [Bacteroidota bacterium]